MKSRILKHHEKVLGFVFALTFTLFNNVSLSDLSWGFWLSGLCICWMSILMAFIKTSLLQASSKEYLVLQKILTKYIPIKYQYLTIKIIIFCSAICIGSVCFYLYCYLFGFYGIFLSVFAEMPPYVLFGRNGFINSDFFTPVAFLLEKFWYLVLGTLASEIYFLSTISPFKFIINQFDREILKIHLIILCLPFVSLGSWMLLGNRYEKLSLIIILALYFLVSNKNHDKTRKNLL